MQREVRMQRSLRQANKTESMAVPVRPTLLARILKPIIGARPVLAQWTYDLEEGEDAGFFGPGSAVWAVNGGLPTMVAGIRALLIQTLHPGAMAGVHDHSRYREDPMGRLDGTVRWVLTTTYGDRAQATAVSAFVTKLHHRVTGEYVDASGAERDYAANDPELLSWVHVAFTEAFIGAHEIWGGPIPGGPDAYVREWAKSGELMGVANPPTSVRQLREQLAAFTMEAKPDERVREAVRFLRRPNLEGNVGAVYPILFAGATASLPKTYRDLLGLRRPRWPAITATRLLIAFVGALSGSKRTPSERFARARIDRIALDSTG
jgi:uncharacterized protein (DUF2236 family)